MSIPTVTKYITYDPNSQTDKDFIDIFKSKQSIEIHAPIITGYDVDGYDLSQIFEQATLNPDSKISYDTNYSCTTYGDLKNVFMDINYNNPIFTATGTYTTLDGANNWHVIQFTGTNPCSITFNYNISVYYLIVGSGGRGDDGGIMSAGGGSGGGGGGVITNVTNTALNLTAGQNYPITIGYVSIINYRTIAFGLNAYNGFSLVISGGPPNGGAGGYGGGGVPGSSNTNSDSINGNISVNPAGSNLNLTYSVGNGGGEGGTVGYVVNDGGSGGGTGGGTGGTSTEVFDNGGGGGGGGESGGNGGDSTSSSSGNGGAGGGINNPLLAKNATLSFGNGGGGGGGGIYPGSGGQPSPGCVVIWFQYP